MRYLVTWLLCERTQHRQDDDSMLIYRWTTVGDGRPALNQHRIVVLRSTGWRGQVARSDGCSGGAGSGGGVDPGGRRAARGGTGVDRGETGGPLP